MAFTGPIEDRLAIRERLETYADAVFRRDPDAWIDCWTEDAVWSLPGLTVEGRPTIRAAWLQAMSAFELAAFFSAPGAISVDGDQALATVYTQELLVSAGAGVLRVVGVYDDELVREPDGWRFRRRTYRFLHREPGEGG